MSKYRLSLLFWGPVALGIVLSILFYGYNQPDITSLHIPRLPSIYQGIPRLSPERIRYVPQGILPAGVLPPEKYEEEKHRPAQIFELRAILKVGERKICKFNEELLYEGQYLGPFKIVAIGENYVELKGEQRVRVYVGEKISF